MNSQEKIKILVVGASIGGVDALIKLMSNLPANPGFSICIVQHLKTGDKPTQLARILDQKSLIKIVMATDNTLIQPGHGYVAEPGLHLVVEKGRTQLVKGETRNHVMPSADVLFESAAREYGSRVIGVILTGTGRDGTLGCKAIKAAKGITIAQDKESSMFFNMPESAIKANAIDYILPLADIPLKIMELCGQPLAFSG